MNHKQNNSHLKALLIEDDLVDAMIVKKAFAKMNTSLSIVVAKDGEKALDILRGGAGLSPAVILLDPYVSKMDWKKFLATVKGDPVLTHNFVCVIVSSIEDEHLFLKDDLRPDAFMYWEYMEEGAIRLTAMMEILQKKFHGRLDNEEATSNFAG